MSAPKPILTQERLKELLRYDPETGVFTRRVRVGRNWFAGTVAGSNRGHRKYQTICVCFRHYLAHRLAWFYVHGEWPPNQIDHIDGDRFNNKISNLRKATVSENRQNVRAAYKSSKTGILGVSFYKSHSNKPWYSRIYADGKSTSLGFFYTAQEAHAAYLAAKAKYHPFQTLVPPAA